MSYTSFQTSAKYRSTSETDGHNLAELSRSEREALLKSDTVSFLICDRVQRPYIGSVFHRKMKSENIALHWESGFPSSFSGGKRFLYTASGLE